MWFPLCEAAGMCANMTPFSRDRAVVWISALSSMWVRQKPAVRRSNSFFISTASNYWRREYCIPRTLWMKTALARAMPEKFARRILRAAWCWIIKSLPMFLTLLRKTLERRYCYLALSRFSGFLTILFGPFLMQRLSAFWEINNACFWISSRWGDVTWKDIGFPLTASKLSSMKRLLQTSVIFSISDPGDAVSPMIKGYFARLWYCFETQTYE